MSPGLKTSKWKLKWTQISHLHVQLYSNSRLSRGKFLFIVPVYLESTVLSCAQRHNNKEDGSTCFYSNLNSEKQFCFIISTTSKHSFVIICCNKRDRLELLNNWKVAASLQSWLLTPAVFFSYIREVNPVYNKMFCK